MIPWPMPGISVVHSTFASECKFLPMNNYLIPYLCVGGLPLSLLSEGDKDLLERKPNLSITKNFPMVTIAQR